MNRILLLIICFYIAICGCHNLSIVTEKVPVNSIDTSINKTIFLRDAYSVIKNFGNIESKVNQWDTVAPDIYVTNNSKTEYLKMTKWYGDGANVFSFFEVGIITILPNSISILSSNLLNFKTESGIKLGITKENLMLIKGNKYIESKLNDLAILTYTDGELYKAEYCFQNNKLIKFSFGYVSP